MQTYCGRQGQGSHMLILTLSSRQNIRRKGLAQSDREVVAGDGVGYRDSWALGGVGQGHKSWCLSLVGSPPNLGPRGQCQERSKGEEYRELDVKAKDGHSQQRGRVCPIRRKRSIEMQVWTTDSEKFQMNKCVNGQIILCNILNGSSGSSNMGISSWLSVFKRLRKDKGRNLFPAHTFTRISVRGRPLGVGLRGSRLRSDHIQGCPVQGEGWAGCQGTGTEASRRGPGPERGHQGSEDIVAAALGVLTVSS